MWTSVYMTQSLETAKAMRQKIEEKSISVMLHKMVSPDGSGADYYELLVPSAELNEAIDIIID